MHINTLQLYTSRAVVKEGGRGRKLPLAWAQHLKDPKNIIKKSAILGEKHIKKKISKKKKRLIQVKLMKLLQ